MLARPPVPDGYVQSLLGCNGKTVTTDAHAPHAIAPAVSSVEDANMMCQRMALPAQKGADIKGFDPEVG